MRSHGTPTVLIAADVFGLTQQLRVFARELGATAAFVSPHEGTARFADEQEGYAAFVAAGGVAAYAARAAQALSDAKRPFDLALGFSAGASALWLCLAEAALAPCLPRRAELFYGSRIREYAGLAPLRPVRLVFAEREASFAPGPLAEHLRGPLTDASVLPGSAHGFMNPLSPGYDARLLECETERLRRALNAGR